MKSLEENVRENNNLKLFEIEKVFSRNSTDITENYEISSVITSNEKIPYYEMQKIVTDYLKTI